MKLNQLDSENKRAIEEELEAKASSIGLDAYDTYESSNNNHLKDLVGICYNCKWLQFCRAEFSGHDKIFAKCALFELHLSGNNRITECNQHAAKKMLSLNEMWAMATLIDPQKDEVKGFISTDPKLMKRKDIP